MTLFLQQVVNGLVLGSIYTLVALGMTLIQGTLRIPNIAHGSLYMCGAYVTYYAATVMGINYWLSIVIAMMVMGFFGLIVERVYKPVKEKAPPISLFVAGIGILVLLNNSMRLIFGPHWKYVREPIPGMLQMGDIRLTYQRLIIIIAAVVCIILLNLFLKKTLYGSTIDAMAQNEAGASLVGINVRTTSMVTFFIASSLAALAAALIVPMFLAHPEMGTMVVLRGMAIIVIGGLGSVIGAILGGYILGLGESLSLIWIPAAYQDLIAFGILLIILTVKPTGLMGRA